MIRLLPLLTLACLVGCSNPAEDAEAQYNIVAAKGSLGEKCQAAQKVRDAYLANNDSTNYSLWQSRAAVDCEDVSLYGAEMPADPAIRAKANADVDNIEASIANASR
jgi:hypothetical protein